MTVAQSWPLQQAVFQAVSSVAGNVPVLDHAPQVIPDAYLRLDGFSIASLDPKNGRSGRHAFEVHYFVASARRSELTRGQNAVKTMLALVDAAIMSSELAGGLPHFESMEVDADEGTYVHGRLRYTVIF